MSQITTIALKNKAAATVSFIRESASGLIVTLRDSTATVFVQAARLTLRTFMPGKKGNVVRHQRELTMPVYDANGLKLREYRYSDEFLLPTTGTALEREEFQARVASLMAATVTTENVVDLNSAS